MKNTQSGLHVAANILAIGANVTNLQTMLEQATPDDLTVINSAAIELQSTVTGFVSASASAQVASSAAPAAADITAPMPAEQVTAEVVAELAAKPGAEPPPAKAGLPKLVAIIGICAMLAAFAFGCATPNVQTIPAQTNAVSGVVTPPVTITNYVPNQTAAQVAGYAAQVAPLIPSPYNTLLLALAGVVTAVTGTIAGIKNNQTNAANANATAHSNAAAAMAQALVNANVPTATTLAIAGTNGSAGIVAQHLVNAAQPV